MQQYDTLVHSIYDAALDPTGWPSVVGHIAEACASSRCLLFTPAHGTHQGGFTIPHNISQAALERWAAKNMNEDPFVRAAQQRNLLREGHVVDCVDLVSEHTLATTPFYKELWAPLEIGRASFSVVFDGTDARKLPTVLSAYRRADEAPFDKPVLELLGRIAGHLSRALGVMYHLREAQWQMASTLASLDRLPAGVLLLGAQGTLEFANAAAQRMLERSEPIAWASGAGTQPAKITLTSRLKGFQSELHKAVEDALSPLRAGSRHFSQATVLPDEHGKPAWVVHTAPLGRHPALRPHGTPPRAIAFVYDLAAAAGVSAALLRELFHLTPAETRAALQVLKGGTADEMAARLGVALTTFKTQLALVYAKTGTHRQADLLKLFLALGSA